MNYEKWRMHYETLPDGTRAQVRDGYTMRNGYYTRDGHGGMDLNIVRKCGR